jgi:hypothetical protein
MIMPRNSTVYDLIINTFGLFDFFNEIHQIRRTDDGRVIQLKTDIDTFELHANRELTEFELYGRGGREVYRGNNWNHLSTLFFDNYRDDWI